MSSTTSTIEGRQGRLAPFKSGRAFTLVELLVVLAVVAILAAAATPAVGRWIEDYRVKGASRRLMSDLQFARMKAVAENGFYQLYFNQAANRYWIQAWDPVGSAWYLVGTTRVLSDPANASYAPGVTLGFSTGGDKTVTFSSMGEATPAITAAFTSADYERDVTVAITGSIQAVQVR